MQRTLSTKLRAGTYGNSPAQRCPEGKFGWQCKPVCGSLNFALHCRLICNADQILQKRIFFLLVTQFLAELSTWDEGWPALPFCEI